MKTFILLFLPLLIDVTEAKILMGGFTGGGSGITILREHQPNEHQAQNGQRLLTDYLLLDANFVDHDFYEYKDEVYHKLYWDLSGNIQQQWVYSGPHRLFKKIAGEWIALPLGLAGIEISLGLDGNVEWSITDQTLNSSRPLKKNEVLTAYYQRSKKTNESEPTYEILISRWPWDDSGIFSQAGLIAHESLRHAQIGMADPTKVKNFDDEILQQVTAIFMLCKPRPFLSTYMSLLMGNADPTQFEKYGTFASVVKKYCERRDQL